LNEPFKQMLGALLKKEGWKQGAYEFKLRGYPWFATGVEGVAARLMLLSMLEILEAHGFSLYTSFDYNTGQSGGEGSIIEKDTWFCRRPMGWTPGAPVFH
jgi:hypothetical protein